MASFQPNNYFSAFSDLSAKSDIAYSMPTYTPHCTPTSTIQKMVNTKTVKNNKVRE